MLWLALDTSTALGGLALAEDDELLVESLMAVRATRSETVLPELDRWLRRIGRGAGEIGAIVVGSGPGSFTGVRIAASVAKGLCFATGARLYAYSSLEAVAAGTGAPGKICATFDARRGEVYAAAYEDAQALEVVLPPTALRVAVLLERLGRPAEWSFAGEGAQVHAAEIRASGGRVLPPHVGRPRAASLLWIARRWPERGLVREPPTWEPEYVRRPGPRRTVGSPPAAPVAGGSAP